MWRPIEIGRGPLSAFLLLPLFLVQKDFLVREMSEHGNVKACYLAFIWRRENTCYAFKLKGGEEEKREERGNVQSGIASCVWIP